MLSMVGHPSWGEPLMVDVRQSGSGSEQRSAGRWPLMLCTGWVVVRRITWVSPSVGLVTLPGKLPATYTRDPGGRMAKFLLVKFSVMAEITDAGALRVAALEKFDDGGQTSDDYPDTADWHAS